MFFSLIQMAPVLSMCIVQVDGACHSGELLEKVVGVQHLLEGLGRCNILGFCRGGRHHGLLLTHPRYRCTIEKNGRVRVFKCRRAVFKCRRQSKRKK